MKKRTYMRMALCLAMAVCFVSLSAIPSSGAEAPAAAAEEQPAASAMERPTAADYMMWGFYDDAKAQELEKAPEPGAVYSTLVGKYTFEYFQAEVQKYLAEHENDPDAQTIDALHSACELRAYEDVMANGLLPPGFDPANPEVKLSDLPVITDEMSPEEQEWNKGVQISLYAIYLLQQEQERCQQLRIDLSTEEMDAFLEEAGAFLNSGAVEITDDGQLFLKQEDAEIPQTLLPVMQKICAEQPDFLSVQPEETAE